MKNDYDTDITVWSPQGRLIQVEYALEAVSQGSACVGLKSKENVVLVGLQRSSSELSTYLKKLFKIDEKIGMAVSGLTADGRVLCKWLRNECLNHRYVYDTDIVAGRLVRKLADKAQVHTQRYGRRPYGVGVLISSYDSNGAHLYEVDPAGNYFEYKAQAIGAKCQSARTYLESNFESFENATLDELIKHGLIALRETLPRKKTETKDKEPEALDVNNCVVSIVGANIPHIILTPTQLQPYIETLDATPRTTLGTVHDTMDTSDT